MSLDRVVTYVSGLYPLLANERMKLSGADALTVVAPVSIARYSFGIVPSLPCSLCWALI